MIVSENTSYKIKIMNELCGIPEILELVNNPDIEDPEDMKNVNIFSRMRIPNTTIAVKNYICFNFNSQMSPLNKDFKRIYFDLAIICHEDDITTEWGNRHDIMDGVIVDKFNWSKFLGFELELISDVESIMNENYYVRTLRFENLAPNSLQNGVKMSGY